MPHSRDVTVRSLAAERRPRVLVVDDYGSVREWMTRRLHLADIDVLDASTGESAVAIARHERLDLALIDYHLSGINGVETAVSIQRCGVHLPWVLFSGAENDQAAGEAMQHGAIRVVWSPFDVCAVAREALDAVKSRRLAAWSRLRHADRLEEPRTTIGYAAWWILRACTSPVDLSRLGPWAAFVPGATYYSLRSVYLRIGVEPRDARDFMRILRALAQAAGRADHVEGQLALGDPRTTREMLNRARLAIGLPRRSRDV